jgi:hypothetical protein
MPSRLTLLPLDQVYAVCRLGAEAPLPHWLVAAELVSITRTKDELSIICPQEVVPPGVPCERGWRGFRVAGKFEFTAIGVLASLVGPLADAGISVLAISTFDTDYVLVKENRWGDVVEALRRAGHILIAENRDGLR